MNLQLNFTRERYTILFRIFMVFFILFYFVPTGIDFHKLSVFHLPLDYLGHALFCFTLFFFYISSFDFEKKTKNAESLLMRVLGLAIIVSSLEFIQLFTPWRSFSWIDLLSNLSGMALGTLLAFLKKVCLK